MGISLGNTVDPILTGHKNLFISSEPYPVTPPNTTNTYDTSNDCNIGYASSSFETKILPTIY